VPEDHKPAGSTRPNDPPDSLPMDQRATTEVVRLVVDVEIDRLLGHHIAKEQALTALAARQEIEQRMRRHRWLAIETARRAGATWREIDHTLGRQPGQSRLEHQQTLDRQKAFGLACPSHQDPGVPTGPVL
jgi:hypothetical protein